MFNNRNYQTDDHEAGANKMLFGIICVTVLFFLLTMSLKSPLGALLILHTDSLKDFQLWRLLSSLLVNPSGWNLFFEMFALYIFGTIITPRLGGSKMLGLYLFSGLFGNLLWLALNWNTSYGIYGCGGAVTGVIMASAMAAPNMQLYLLFIPFPIKLRTMAIVFILLDLLLAGLTPFALLDAGGFIGGYLFMRLFLRKTVEWDMLDMAGFKKKKSSDPYIFVQDPGAPKKERKMPTREEVDRILDKLSRTGINSLTPDEVKTLEEVREQMNKK
ncbi:MAG: intramembrane serine protease GlpG [Lentisphaerae bacterium ADurb.Bin242]|nr:MAG: intramembrane serine protease GlpG [Lentisphaerae bacterium ADurb.Bin242]